MAIRIMGEAMTLMIDNCVAVIWLLCRYVAESEEFAADLRVRALRILVRVARPPGRWPGPLRRHESVRHKSS